MTSRVYRHQGEEGMELQILSCAAVSTLLEKSVTVAVAVPVYTINFVVHQIRLWLSSV